MRSFTLPLRLVALLGALGLLVGFMLLVVRPWYLTWGASAEEQRRRLPGDEIVPQGHGTTRAITVRAPAATTWAWLAQTGQDRGGFYSFELLEDLAGCQMPNVQRLDPALQRWKAGDKLWMYPPGKAGGIGGAPLVTLIPGRALAFGTHQFGTPTTAPPDGSWAFVVEPIDATTSRLLVRSRGAGGYPWFGQAFDTAVFGPAHFVMERKMMSTIATLAEGGTVSRVANDTQVALWVLTFVAFVASAVQLLRGRQPGRRMATLLGAGAIFMTLTFAQPSPWLGLPLVAALLVATWLPTAGTGARPIKPRRRTP